LSCHALLDEAAAKLGIDKACVGAVYRVE